MLAWGAAAFGAVYTWAYIPLFFSATLIGLAGLWFGRRARDVRALTVALSITAFAISVQLIPLPPAFLEQFVPATARLLAQHSLSYSIGEMSHPLSIDPERTRLGLAAFLSLAVLLLGSAAMLTRLSARHLVTAITVLGFVLAMVGIVQRASLTSKVYGVWQSIDAGSPFGPFINRNHFAGWMLMAIPPSVGLLIALVERHQGHREQSWRKRLLWLSSPEASQVALGTFAVIVMALALILSLSRSGMLAAMAALVWAFWMTRRLGAATNRRVLLLCAMLIAIAVMFAGVGTITSRFASPDTTSVGGRVAIWQTTLRIASDHWSVGTGLNTYGVSTLYYQPPLPDRHLREAHSDYLQLASEGGILLGLPILFAVVVFYRLVRARLREDTGSVKWIRLGAVCGLIAIAVQSAADFSLQMPGNAALFAVVAGLALHDGRR
jgi:O-antigen ligase